MRHRHVARLRYGLLALSTIAVGLLVHGRGAALGPDAQDVLGDALWAMMLYWWIGVLGPHWPVVWRSGVSDGVCVAVELSQRVHGPTLDAVRQTTLGALVLGTGFDPRDFVSYAVGVAIATALDWWGLRRRGDGPRSGGVAASLRDGLATWHARLAVANRRPVRTRVTGDGALVRCGDAI